MLRLQTISKAFAGVKALQNVSLQFNSGEVHAICGENGAGKSTLMNIIMGNVQPDEGEIFWKEKAVVISDVLAAQQLGFAIVYQERSLAESLSLAENIFPVNLPLTSAGLIDYTALYKKAEALLNELGLSHLSPKTVVRKLSAAEKQMVEIAKAIAQQPSLLILDEPTASITHTETDILFRIIHSLKQKGRAILYVSHRMAEIGVVADKISVLKDGNYVGTVSPQVPTQQIIRMMVGRDLEAVTHKSHAQREVILEAKNLTGKGFSNISFRLHKGEILGVAGLQGSGRGAMARTLFGDAGIQSGAVYKNGKAIAIHHPSDAIQHRIVYLPDDRKTDGLFLEKTVAENFASVHLRKGAYNKIRIAKKAESLVEKFSIRTLSVRQPVRKLSGGNQQKILLARCMDLQPDVLLVNEPTHGVDVGSKADIYRLLKGLTAEGKSILLISSELPELLLLSDRIAVMYEGRLQAVVDRKDASEEKVALLASGVKA